VAALTRQGEEAILRKIGEESGGWVIAAKNGGKEAAIHEPTDLWFHVMVWMAHVGHSLDELRPADKRERAGKLPPR
jgi:phosphoribosyl-ATP pyrophosphohydrolase